MVAVLLTELDVIWRSCGAKKVKFVSVASGPFCELLELELFVLLVAAAGFTAMSVLMSCWVELYWATNALIALAMSVTSGATVT
jgi:hypothetical protein